MSVRCEVCGARAVHLHHAVYRQFARDLPEGMDIDAPENLMPLCVRHHARHHTATERIPVSRMRPETVEFFTRAGLEHRLHRTYDMET